MPIRFNKVSPAAVVPKAASDRGAGLDLTVIETVTIPPGKIGKCRTGLAVALPSGTYGLIQPRSSAYMAGIGISGVIDAEYRGELMLMIRNLNDTPLIIEAGKRYAQMLVMSYDTSAVETVMELDETVRGEGGFGSTGQ